MDILGTAVTLGFVASVGVLATKSYGATWKQSVSYVLGDLLILAPVSTLFLRTKNSYQLVGLILTTRIVSCLSGVLATQLLSEKRMHWRHAIAAQAIFYSIMQYIVVLQRDPMNFKACKV